MTIKELKEILNRYDDNAVVNLEGGESKYGEYGRLSVGHTKTVHCWMYDCGEKVYYDHEVFVTEAVIWETE